MNLYQIVKDGLLCKLYAKNKMKKTIVSYYCDLCEKTEKNRNEKYIPQ